ncbi:MAG: primosomal protein N' [Oscillospiraceae bacterium]|nr:primosomal protein N' [Oscillospiraceae bacterium]
MEQTLIALVAVENTSYSFDTLFSYIVPEGLCETLRSGMRVAVPFGRGNKSRIGLVFDIAEGASEKLKELLFAVDEEPCISEEQLKLCRWLRDTTFCTYFDAFRTILPPGLSFSLKTHYCVNGEYSGELTDKEREFIAKLSAASDGIARDEIVTSCGDGGRMLKALLQKGAVRENDELKRRVGDETARLVRLAEPEEMPKLTPKQKQVVEFVEGAEAASVKEVCYACCVTAAVVKRLVEKGVLELYEQTVFRTEPAEMASQSPESIVFSEKQQEVFDGLLGLMRLPEPKCALLRGITGSGKTSVFIRLINEALKDGRSAMMLVPEISLTPQMVGKFRSLFGGEVAVLHSSLSLGERADEYRRIECGKARIVIGTRSAVFAPVRNLGIIVIDEEGESTYKSENAPRYHAREAAKQRCFAHNAFLLLASATPSLESYYNAKTGRYSLFELDERYNNAVLPDVYIVDMKVEQQNGNHSSFSMPLLDEIQANLERGEQSILLLNRRGYHTSVRCAHCGASTECPNCAVPLTYHKANGSVICHYCGFSQRLAQTCPKCGSRYMMMKGTGTQRVEDELSEIFPRARILRMDADTTSTKHAFEQKFRAFADGEYDIIVGTQMIAKGLDFPNVTLVGVLKTDNSLYAGDFKAYERTFSLVTQVVGRSGRGGRKGRAMIQTFTPEHYVLNLAARQDYPAFYEEEIKLREAMLYPPFCDIISVTFSALSESNCALAARRFTQLLEQKRAQLGREIPLRVLGPAKCAAAKINGRHRYRLIIKCRSSSALRELIENTLKAAGQDEAFRNVGFFADMNGETL